MGNTNVQQKFKQISPLLGATLAIWFVANLTSQLVFISIHGNPYDGLAMLMSLGPIYIAILLAEAILWVWVCGAIVHDMVMVELTICSTNLPDFSSSSVA